MYKILIVEDHETLGYVLQEYLKMQGFQTCLATSGEEGLRQVNKWDPHLCLVDISLPGMDGFELATKIRSLHPTMPLIFLTARGLKVDKIKGFKLQADDYIVKPVDEEELVLRIKSVLRRVHPKTEASRSFQLGRFIFEPANHTLKIGTESKILTEKETAILYLLCADKGSLVKRTTILRQVWGSTDFFTTRTMDVHLTKLRKHLAADPSISIVNVHGQGFILKDS